MEYTDLIYDIIEEVIDELHITEADVEYTDVVYDIVEEVINELKITDKALEYKMKKSRANANKYYKKASKALDKFSKKTFKSVKDAIKAGKDHPLLHYKDNGNETDADQEQRVYPEETKRIAGIWTNANREDNRADRAAERLKNRQTGSNDNTASKVVKTNLYKKEANHWGWHPRSGKESQSKYEA